MKKWGNSTCVCMATQQNSIYAIYDFVLQADVNISFYSKPCDIYTSWMALEIFLFHVDFVSYVCATRGTIHTCVFNIGFLVLKVPLKMYRGCHWYFRMKCLGNVRAHIHGDTKVIRYLYIYINIGSKSIEVFAIFSANKRYFLLIHTESLSIFAIWLIIIHSYIFEVVGQSVLPAAPYLNVRKLKNQKRKKQEWF